MTPEAASTAPSLSRLTPTGEKDGQKLVAVNVNCLDGVDARALNSHFVDGAGR